MANIDEDLNQIEMDIRRLKIEYEQYFGGGRSRPPSDTQWRAELLLKRYSDRTADMNFGQRFRFNNLAMTYAKYHEMWRKRLKQKEEGAVQRHFGAAAREVGAGRARPETTPSVAVFVMACSDPLRETHKVEQLYWALVEARQKAQEKGDPPTREAFQQFILKKNEQLRQQMGAEEVEYSVAVEGGQVKLKAKAKI
jgi:hypothetical protein